MHNSCTTYEAPLGTSDNLNPHWYQSFLLCITASLCIFELCLLAFQDWIQIIASDNLGTYINCNAKLQVMLLFFCCPPVNCWPSENDGQCDVNIEYELLQENLELNDVVISIPVP